MNVAVELSASQTHELERQLLEWRERVDGVIARWLPAETEEPIRLHKAMRYAATGGGKRVRPVLIYATGQALGLDPVEVDASAAAVELMHAYSLVHDDLPAMDDDDLRRGRPTCHIQFDEATAILAGDALQALAYQVLSQDPASSDRPSLKARLIAVLAHASGSEGMAGGQAIDLVSVGKTLDLQALEQMHRLKTGALFRACIALAACTAGDRGEALLPQLDRYADAIGLAFQIVDDILDVTGDASLLGKSTGADRALDKPTYPSLLGLEGARAHAREMHQAAVDALQGLGAEFDFLRSLSAYVIGRDR